MNVGLSSTTEAHRASTEEHKESKKITSSSLIVMTPDLKRDMSWLQRNTTTRQEIHKDLRLLRGMAGFVLASKAVFS